MPAGGLIPYKKGQKKKKKKSMPMYGSNKGMNLMEKKAKEIKKKRK